MSFLNVSVLRTVMGICHFQFLETGGPGKFWMDLPSRNVSAIS